MLATFARVLPVVVAASIASVFSVGARRGFAMRTPQRPAWTRFGFLCWLVVIGALVGGELWQLGHDASTASALVRPLLAVPLVRVVALAVWLWLGWELARK